MIETFEQYLEDLATRHPMIKHNDKNRCHYTFLSEDGQNKLASTMHYPCIVADSGDFDFNGQPGNVLLNTEYSVLFLQRVSDTGSNKEITKAYSDMRKVLLDFAAQFVRDKKVQKYKFLNRFTLIGGRGNRIYHSENSLYGYALLFTNDTFFSEHNYNNVFID